jgi:hypothetical protein
MPCHRWVGHTHAHTHTRSTHTRSTHTHTHDPTEAAAAAVAAHLTPIAAAAAYQPALAHMHTARQAVPFNLVVVSSLSALIAQPGLTAAYSLG